MKKYLITGALALVACATLTSCHSDDELSGSLIEQKLQTYEQVFKQEFGEVNPNQDWGFGTAKSLLRTRTAMGTRADGQWANYHGEQADGHLWTSYGFHAPDALSAGQKLRVQFYFQTVKNPGGTKNYGVIDFFMQQVYDGCTDPITNYSNLGYTSPTYSLEKYPAASSTETHTDYIESGEHMDHLTASDDNSIEHINNFNNGNFPDPIPNVANWDQTVQDDHSQEHEDQIMLMLNTPTKYFGYANSDASYVRTDRWRLVSGDVIDNYCDNEKNAEWLAFLRAHSGVEDDPCYDEWKRSYIGFDFDMIPDDNVFAGQKVDANNNPVYNGPYDHMNYTYFSINLLGDDNKVWNGTELVDANTVGEIGYLNGNKVLYPYKPGTTEKIHLISANTNMFCGDTDETSWTDNDWRYSINNGPTYTKILTSKLSTALTNGWLPKNDKEWVKVGGCNDGYYSDWIVSFMPASPVNEPEPNTITIPIEGGGSSDYILRTYKQLRFITKFNQCGRIMCEDLGTSSISDIDFNDIVFDAWMYDIMPQIRTKIVKVENGRVTETIHDWSDDDWTDWTDAPSEYAAYTLTDVYLLAGGGTIPATVAGVSLKNAFGTDNRYLVNTVDERDPQNIKRYGNPYKNGNPYNNRTGWNQPIIEDLRGIKNLESFNKIDVVVLYNNSPVPLTSEIGEVPHKICVPIKTKWPYERIVINEAYDFNDYVKNGSSVQYVGENAEPIYNSNREIIGYYLDEMNRGDENNEDDENNIWKKTPTNDQAGSRYHGTTDYEGEDDITGIPYRDSARVIGSTTDPVDLGYEDETVSGGSSSGYHNGDPVLIRRRH